MTEKSKCKWCGEDFEPRRTWQSFCCTDHQQRWHRQRQLDSPPITDTEHASAQQ